MSEVQAEVEPLTDLWNRYAILISEEPENNGLVPTADSPAMNELSLERRLSRDAWREPVRNAHSYGYILAAASADHLAALAAVAQHAVVGPKFAHLTLLRAMMEMSTLGTWMLEPQIGAERRVKRSLAYRIDNAENLMRLGSGNARVESKAARRRARAAIDALGWKYESGEVDGESLPEAKRDFSRFAFGGPESDTFDHVLWNFAAASTHGTFYALAQTLQTPPGHVVDTLDPRGDVRGVVVSSLNIAMFGSVGYFGVKAAADARRTLMGWPTSPEIEAAHHRGTELAKSVSAAIKQSVAGQANSAQP